MLRFCPVSRAVLNCFSKIVSSFVVSNLKSYKSNGNQKEVCRMKIRSKHTKENTPNNRDWKEKNKMMAAL